jgi:hypothetical protein
VTLRALWRHEENREERYAKLRKPLDPRRFSGELPVAGRPQSHRHPCFHSAGWMVVPTHGDVIVSEGTRS